MNRCGVLLLGITSYVLFLGVFLYAIAFVGNFGVPKTLDGNANLPMQAAIGLDLLLVVLFGLQHSIMARPRFKKWWKRFVPQSIERNVYVLSTVAVMSLLFWLWQPIDGVVWNVTNTRGRAVLYGLFACGWLTVLITTFWINHFDLFGLRQAWLYFRGRPYTPLEFVTPGPYRYVRHPLYVGWLLAFWATPTMGIAHLAFALGMTAYILIAIRYEEHDLVKYHGTQYEEYKRHVPMLLPRFRPAVQPAVNQSRSVGSR